MRLCLRLGNDGGIGGLAGRLSLLLLLLTLEPVDQGLPVAAAIGVTLIGVPIAVALLLCVPPSHAWQAPTLDTAWAQLPQFDLPEPAPAGTLTAAPEGPTVRRLA